MSIPYVSSSLPTAAVQKASTQACPLGKGTCSNCGQCGKPTSNVNASNSTASIGPAAVLTLSGTPPNNQTTDSSSNTINPYEKMYL
jgi:hypothetical protein